jgi:hypothetical protein
VEGPEFRPNTAKKTHPLHTHKRKTQKKGKKENVGCANICDALF